MSWNIYLALKQLLPTGKRFGSFFFVMSMIGVALGVMVLVVVQSVMGGFGQQHRARAIEITGHIDINSNGRPFFLDTTMREALDRDERVEAFGPYANGFVLAQRDRLWMGTMAYGIDPRTPDAYGIADFLTSGTIDDLGDDTVILSRSLMWQLGAEVGDEIEVFTPTMIEGMQSEEMILPRSLEVVGTYSVDWDPDFIPGLVVTLRTMQDFYDLGPSVHGVTIRLGEQEDERVFSADWNEQLPLTVVAHTWERRWAQLLSVLAMEKVLILFIMLFVVAVAIFSIAIAQLLNVVRRTREIGVLLAFGADPRALWGLYCFQGLLIGLGGFVLGSLAAVGLLAVRGPVIDLIVNLTGSREMLLKYYFFLELPVHYAAMDFVIIGASATILSVLAGLLPAWRATQLRPAEAIRVEV